MNAGHGRTAPGGSIGAQVVVAGRRPVPLQEPADEGFLGAVGAVDREAFADLSERIAPHVLGVALRVVRDLSLADEVAQEVVVEVWRKASRFDPARGSVRGWVTTLAHRRVVDRVRSEQASRDRDDRASRRVGEANFDSGVDVVQARLDRSLVRQARETLTPGSVRPWRPRRAVGRRPRSTTEGGIALDRSRRVVQNDAYVVPWMSRSGAAVGAIAELTAKLAFDADDRAWMLEARCLDADPEAFFPEKGGSTRDAKRICAACPVRNDCLDYALSNEERFGIWGGLSERERRRAKRLSA